MQALHVLQVIQVLQVLQVIHSAELESYATQGALDHQMYGYLVNNKTTQAYLVFPPYS